MDSSSLQSARERTPSGTTALTFGILGLTVLPIIGAVIAIVFGSRSKAEHDAAPERYSDDLGRAGRILGYAGLLVPLGLAVLSQVLVSSL